MLITDMLTLLALLGFCFIWLWKDAPGRNGSLWGSALAALVFAGLGYANFRGVAVLSLAAATMLLLVLLVRQLRGPSVLTKTPWISGVLFLALTGCAFFGYWSFPIFSLPEPTGNYTVGVRDFELTDTSRTGVLAAGPDEPRRLLVRAWYPAGSVEGLEPRPYFTEAEANTTGRRLGQHFMQVPQVFTHFRHVETHSYQNAALHPAAEKQPVIFFSHGYTSIASQNTGLMEELASHGYIIYSVSHTYDNADALYPNGDPIPADHKLFEEMMASLMDGGETQKYMMQSFNAPEIVDRRYGKIRSLEIAMARDLRLYRSVPVWIDDRLFVKEELKAGRVDSAIADLVAASDFSRTGHTGMSFGGSTGPSVCYRDADCMAAINMDGGNFDPQMFNRNFEKPLLMFMHDWPLAFKVMGGSGKFDGVSFTDFSYEEHSVAGTRDDLYRLRVRDVLHQGVTDLILAARGPLKSMLYGNIDGSAMMAIMNDFVRGFFDKHLRDIDNNFPAAQFAEHRANVDPHQADKVREWWNGLNDEQRAAIPAGPDIVGSLRKAGKAGLGEINPIATITMEDDSQIVLELYPKQAPESVRSFIYLAISGYYNDQPLWRVEKDRLIQGGSDKLDGSGSPGYAVKGEFLDNGVDNRTRFTPGAIGFARLTPNSGGAGWFITAGNMASLDGKYAAFGHVISGLGHIKSLSQIPAQQLSPEVTFVHTPLQAPTVKSVAVETFGIDYPQPEKLPEMTPEEAAAEMARIRKQLEQAANEQ